MRSRPSRATACSHAEFESLPEALQRKLFSPLERLRIEQEEHAHAQSISQAHARSDASPHHLNLHLLHNNDDRRPSHASSTIRRTLSRPRRRTRKDSALALPLDDPCAHAFFQSLPEKLQRTAFSPEEALELSRPLALHNPLDDFSFGFDRNATPNRGRSRRRRSSLSSTEISPTRGPASRPLQLLDPVPMAPSRQSSRASYRRTLSLSTMPARTSFSSATLAPEPQSARGTAPWHQRAQSHSVSARRSSHNLVHPPLPLPAPLDSEAAHYRDPEARRKLRMFLASPQKFDEAVEFGFPSTSGSDAAQHRYQLPPIKTDARNFSRDVQNFLREDRVSFFEDTPEDENKGLESDDDSVPDVDSPLTPSSVGLSFRSHARKQSSNMSTAESTGLTLINPLTGRFNREMTLRMTLTRPDLRADDDQLYGWQGHAQNDVKEDPFALADLALTDDMDGSRGPFYIKPKQHGNLVTRLFKRGGKKN